MHKFLSGICILGFFLAPSVWAADNAEVPQTISQQDIDQIKKFVFHGWSMDGVVSIRNVASSNAMHMGQRYAYGYAKYLFDADQSRVGRMHSIRVN